MSLQSIDLQNKKHRIIVQTIQKLSPNPIDYTEIAIDEDYQMILCKGKRYYYDFQKVEDQRFCVIYNRDKNYICSYLSYDISRRVKNKKISSCKGKVRIPKVLAASLAGVGLASVLIMSHGNPHKDTSFNFESTISGEVPQNFSYQHISYVPSIPDGLENHLVSEEIEIEPDYIDGSDPHIEENFATIQTGNRRENAKYFSYHKKTTARNLLKARNTMEFMGDEITYWSTHFGLDPKFVMALFTLERPWLPMDNDLVSESYHPTYFGEGSELNVAQITNGAKGVYKVPTFDHGKFLGYEIYDLGTGSGKGRQISIAEAKTNRSLSIEAGCALLAHLLSEKYQGNAIYAALGYNTGEGRVNTKISEEDFFEKGNSNTLDDRTYASDLVRYMANTGITNCDFYYVDKNGIAKQSHYDFDTSGRQLDYKEMNLHADTEIPRLAQESVDKYLAKYGKKGAYFVDSIKEEPSMSR